MSSMLGFLNAGTSSLQAGELSTAVALLLTPEELTQLVAQALLATAERIASGKPVDAHRSVAAAARK